MKREGLAFLFPDFTPKRGLTEAQAFARLEAAAAEIVKRARWNSLSQAKVNELRQPLIELRLARRQQRHSMNKGE